MEEKKGILRVKERIRKRDKGEREERKSEKIVGEEG
jgi:hypothetical protein